LILFEERKMNKVKFTYRHYGTGGKAHPHSTTNTGSPISRSQKYIN
jgi:hypothetical protein